MKLSLLFFNIGLSSFITTVFYTNSQISNIFQQEGLFRFFLSLPKRIYSSLISCFFISCIKYLILTENCVKGINKEKILETKKQLFYELVKHVRKYSIAYTIINQIVLLLFMYYVCSFCSVFCNTQKHLFKSIGISILLSYIIPFVMCLILSIIRIGIITIKCKCLVYFEKVFRFFC